MKAHEILVLFKKMYYIAEKEYRNLSKIVKRVKNPSKKHWSCSALKFADILLYYAFLHKQVFDTPSFVYFLRSYSSMSASFFERGILLMKYSRLIASFFVANFSR